MKNSKVKPVNDKVNKKRREAKLKRGIGLLAMKKAGATHAQWTQDRDPLFHVKGMDRHRLVTG